MISMNPLHRAGSNHVPTRPAPQNAQQAVAQTEQTKNETIAKVLSPAEQQLAAQYNKGLHSLHYFNVWHNGDGMGDPNARDGKMTFQELDFAGNRIFQHLNTRGRAYAQVGAEIFRRTGDANNVYTQTAINILNDFMAARNFFTYFQTFDTQGQGVGYGDIGRVAAFDTVKDFINRNDLEQLQPEGPVPQNDPKDNIIFVSEFAPPEVREQAAAVRAAAEQARTAEQQG